MFFEKSSDPYGKELKAEKSWYAALHIYMYIHVNGKHILQFHKSCYVWELWHVTTVKHTVTVPVSGIPILLHTSSRIYTESTCNKMGHT